MPISTEGYLEREIQALFGTTTPDLQWIDGKGVAICLHGVKIPNEQTQIGFKQFIESPEEDFTADGTFNTNSFTVAETIEQGLRALEVYQVNSNPKSQVYHNYYYI